MKRIPFVLLALLLSGVACSDDSEGPKKEGESDPVTLTLSDPNATEETKALYSNPLGHPEQGVHVRSPR